MNDDTIDLHDAAKSLNVGVDYLERLLDDGTFGAERAGDGRRIRRVDVLAFKARRDGERREGLRGLTRLTEESGGYEHE